MKDSGSITIRSVYRGIYTTVSFTVIYLICAFSVNIFATGMPIFQGLDPYVISIFPTLLAPIIYNSFALAFAYSDQDHINEFIAEEYPQISLASEIKRIFRSYAVVGLISSILPVLILSALGVFFTFKTMFPPELRPGNWFCSVTLTPICLLSYITARYEASRFYRKMHKRKELQDFCAVRWLIKRLILLALIYIIISPVVPVCGLILLSFFNILVMMSEVMTVIGLIAAVLLLIFMIWGIRVICGISGRKKLLKRLRALAADSGYTLGEIKNPYRSFATSKDQCSFTLTIDDEQFDCIMISTLNKRTPLIFTSASDAYFLHRIGSEKHHTSIHHNIEFLHSAQGKKIVIIDPVPRAIFAEEGDEKRKISPADRIWGITLYDADSFLGCADRKCL